MTHQNTHLTQTQMCPKGFDDEQEVKLQHDFQPYDLCEPYYTWHPRTRKGILLPGDD